MRSRCSCSANAHTAWGVAAMLVISRLLAPAIALNGILRASPTIAARGCRKQARRSSGPRADRPERGELLDLFTVPLRGTAGAVPRRPPTTRLDPRLHATRLESLPRRASY